MSTITTITTLDELKSKQQQIWSSGDYNRIAAITVPVSEALVAGPTPAPARRSSTWRPAPGTRPSPPPAAGPTSPASTTCPSCSPSPGAGQPPRCSIDFVEGDAEDLPFAAGSFDRGRRRIGVMFAADHERAAAELVRVTRPGGRISLASWTPTGFIGRLLKTVGAHVPPPAVAQSPTRWGVGDTVRDLLGPDVAGVTASRSTRAPAVRVTRGLRGPLPHLLRPDPLGRRAAHRRRVAGRCGTTSSRSRPTRTASGDGTFVADWEYLVVTATRR